MSNHTVYAVPLIDKAPPMGEAALKVAQPIVIKAILKPGMIFVVAHVLKKEREQDIVDFLSRGRNRIAELLPVYRDDQDNANPQSNGKVGRDKSTVVKLERIGHLAGVG